MVWYGWLIFAVIGWLIYVVGMALGTMRTLKKALRYLDTALLLQEPERTKCLQRFRERLQNDLYGKNWRGKWEARQKDRGL